MTRADFYDDDWAKCIGMGSVHQVSEKPVERVPRRRPIGFVWFRKRDQGVRVVRPKRRVKR